MASTYEIGKVLELDYTVKVGTVLTDATVALTVTLPDNTTASPSVTHVSTGKYSANYTATQNGLHLFRWVASGAVTDALSGQFVIGGLVSLDEVKAQLDDTDTTDDVELQAYIDSVTGAIEQYCGAILPSSRTEWHDPDGSVIMLRTERLVSVTTVTEYRGATSYDYTQITDPTGAGTYTVLVDPALHGKVTRIGQGGFEFPFTGRVKAVYVAGLASVPPAVNLAARLMVQSLWRTQNGGAGLPALTDEPDIAAQMFETMRSPRIRMLLEPYHRVPGIA